MRGIDQRDWPGPFGDLRGKAFEVRIGLLPQRLRTFPLPLVTPVTILEMLDQLPYQLVSAARSSTVLICIT
jgi:hypothetical protein